MEIFKYLDIEHADSFASGRMWLGTTSSYAKLENSRADPADSSVIVRQQKDITVFDEEGRRQARRVGIRIENCVGTILKNNVAMFTCSTAYMMCFSRSSHNTHLVRDKPQVIFKVRDAEAFAVSILKARPDLFMGTKHGSVTYRNIEVAAHSHENVVASAFVKAPRYIPEKEYRFIWNAVPGSNVAPLFVMAPEVTKYIEYLGVLSV